MQPISFFAKYPLVAYNFSPDERVVLTNLLSSLSIRPEVRLNPVFFANYRVQDGERPEDISTNVYGNPYLHWIVLLFNDIINPAFEWPKSQTVLDSYITEKYRGITWVFDLKYNNQEQLLSIPEYFLTTGKRLFSSESGSITGTIQYWNPTLGTLRYTNDSDLNKIGSRPVYVIHSGEVSSNFFANRIIDDSSQAIHHFEKDEVTLNPLGPSPLTVVSDYDSESFTSLQSLYARNEASINQFVVTNRLFEERRNDINTRIRILKPEYVTNILSRFDSLFV